MHSGPGPDPSDLIYKTVASSLLEAMRNLCKLARERCGELEETWPKEMRIHPVTNFMAEGVLYMPRAAESVVLLQTHAHEDEHGAVTTHTNVFAPYSIDTVHLGVDYMKRAEHHMHTCICGHVIPQFTRIPIHIGVEALLDEDYDEEALEEALEELDEALEEDPDEDAEDSEESGSSELYTSDDVRISALQFEEESDYACPACGYKPNKRYD